MAEQELLPLPDWSDCELAVDEERATSLQQFIYNNEPAAASEAKEFRAALQMVLNDARATTSDYRRVLEPIVACYGLGLSPEKFADQVGPWIMEARALLTTEQVQGAWQPIESAPTNGQKVLVAYQNDRGKWRRVCARYYQPETLESELAWDGWSEPGWYEECESAETIYQVEREPTHWMELPAPPIPVTADEWRERHTTNIGKDSEIVD